MWPAPGMRAEAAGAALCRIVLSVGVMTPESEPPFYPHLPQKAQSRSMAGSDQYLVFLCPFYREGS